MTESPETVHNGQNSSNHNKQTENPDGNNGACDENRTKNRHGQKTEILQPDVVQFFWPALVHTVELVHKPFRFSGTNFYE